MSKDYFSSTGIYLRTSNSLCYPVSERNSGHRSSQACKPQVLQNVLNNWLCISKPIERVVSPIDATHFASQEGCHYSEVAKYYNAPPSPLFLATNLTADWIIHCLLRLLNAKCEFMQFWAYFVPSMIVYKCMLEISHRVENLSFLVQPFVIEFVIFKRVLCISKSLC